MTGDLNISAVESPVRPTSVRLDTSRNLSSSDIIKISDFLSQDSLKIPLSYSFPIDF